MVGKSSVPSEPSARFVPNTIIEIVARSRAEQGLPPTISDPGVIARIATMVESALRGATQ